MNNSLRGALSPNVSTRKVGETPTASPQQVAKMLIRNLTGPVIPEARLITAMLRLAAEDAHVEWRRYFRSYAPTRSGPPSDPSTAITLTEFLRSTTIRFLGRRRHVRLCRTRGLWPGIVQEQFAKHLSIDLRAAASKSTRWAHTASTKRIIHEGT